jgi:hypothetical protein
MPTFQSSKVAATVMARSGLDTTTVTGEIAIPTGFATNDVVEMVKVPAGATVLNVKLTSSAGVGATANLAVGDGVDTDRFITSTAFTASAVARDNTHVGHGHRYTADDTIDILAVSIATPTVGTVVRLTVEYTMQQ